MKFTTTTQLLMLAGSAMAVPVVKAPTTDAQILRRAMNAQGLTDGDILNFALTLEHLEDTFYRGALDQFDQAAFDRTGAVPRLRFNIQEISADESIHVTFLTGALKAAGVTPVAACEYNFGLTDVASFLKTSEILEGVGVSAYLGAAAAISEPAYLTAAGSILTVESRHNAYIRDNQMPPMTPFPSPFDIPLGVNQVYSLAARFITKCPDSNPALPVKAFPVLTFGPNNYNPARAGQTAGLRSEMSLLGMGKLYCAWPNVAGTQYSEVYSIDMGGIRARCIIPEGTSGQSYVLLTTSPNALSDDNTVAGPAVVPVQAPYTYPGFPM